VAEPLVLQTSTENKKNLASSSNLSNEKQATSIPSKPKAGGTAKLNKKKSLKRL